MSDLLTDARETLADISSRRPGQTHYDGCRTAHVGCLLAELIEEVERLRLTASERYAIIAGLRCLERQLWADPENLGGDYRDMQRDAATLRGLLERTGSAAH